MSGDLAPEHASTPDFITTATAKPSLLMTKRVMRGADGRPVLCDYDQAKRFDFATVAVAGLKDLAKVLDGFGPRTCAVLGRVLDGINPRGARRLLYPNDGDPATLEDAPHFWLPIDVDAVDCPAALDPIADPEAAVDHVVGKLLPFEMRDIDVYWQLTSSAGIKPGIRLRLVFQLDRALTGAEMRRWLTGRGVDLSIYAANQPIYFARPVFDAGVADPVPRRSGIRVGEHPVVSPPENIPKRPRPNGAAGGNGIDGDGRARGYEAWRDRIGDHAGGEGFFEPIKKAVASYIAMFGTSDGATSKLRTDLERAIRAAPREPAAHPDAYVEKRIDDLDGLIGWVCGREEDKEASDPVAAEMNAEYAVVQVGNKVAILREYNDDNGRPAFALWSPASLKVWLENRSVAVVIDGVARAVPLAKYWLSNGRRRSFDGIVFRPQGAPERYYNIWRGWAASPSPEGSCEKFKAHLRDNVCKGSEELYNWVFGWHADIFQNPGKKCGTAVVLRGKMGTGKTIVGKTFGHLIGLDRHYALVSDPRYITGRFNSHMVSCLLLHADEAFWAGDHAAEGKLKDLVTGTRHPIELKGYEPVFVPNYVRLFVTGNAEWVVPAGMDERRFAVLDVGEAHKQDIPYFAAIDDELEHGGYERLLHELLSFDLSSVDLRTIPRTAALLEQKIESMTPEQAWWMSLLKDGRLPAGCDGDNKVPVDALFRHYLEHADRLRLRNQRSAQTKFGMFLRKVVPGKVEPGEKKVTPGIRRSKEICAPPYAYDWVYHMPPLARCRELFCEAAQQEIDWDESDIAAEPDVDPGLLAAEWDQKVCDWGRLPTPTLQGRRDE